MVDPVAEARLEARMDALCRSVDQGFDRIHRDLGELKTDVKTLHQEGLPRRVGRLEKWRDTTNGRFWRFLVGAGVAAVAAWMSVMIPADWPPS